MIKVYYADVSPLGDDTIYDAAIASLPPQRRKKAEALVQRDDRNLSVGASLVLMHALKLAGYDAHSLEFDIHDGGKPYAKNADVHFSITHSLTLAMCAVADCPVGIDVQKIAPFNPDICMRFFSQSEREQIFASSDEDIIKDTFFRIWTMKESYVKMTGRGLGAFSEFEVRLSPAPCIKGGEECTITELEMRGYKAAVCAKADDAIETEKIKIF